MMAFVPALLSDDQPTPKVSRARLQWIEGGVQALAAMFSAWLIHEWFVSMNSDRVPDLIHLLCKSGIIGFIIGFFVPTWYRQAPSQQAGGDEECSHITATWVRGTVAHPQT